MQQRLAELLGVKQPTVSRMERRQDAWVACSRCGRRSHRALMHFHVATAAASYREATEDRLAVHPVDGGGVVVVADGAGGVSGGGRAADLAVRIVRDALERGTFNRLYADPWVELLIHADAIFASDRHAGETTVVVVAVAEDGVTVHALRGPAVR